MGHRPLWTRPSRHRVRRTSAPRVRSIGRGDIGERVDTDLIAAAPLINCFSEQLELVSCQVHQSAHLEGLSANMNTGCRPGRFSV